MIGIFQLVKNLAGPAIRVLTAIVPVVSVLITTVANPTGAVNKLLVSFIDFIAQFWPSTPEQLKLANLIAGPLESGTTVGQAIIVDLFQTAFLMLSVIVLIKLYKLIPFKAT